MFKKLILIPMLLLALSACAGMTPQQATTNTLLGLHDTITNVETNIKAPCANGMILPSDCLMISNYILQAKPAYNTAVDAQLVWLNSGSPTDQAAYAAKKQALDTLVGDAVALALKYGVKGGPQ